MGKASAISPITSKPCPCFLPVNISLLISGTSPLRLCCLPFLHCTLNCRHCAWPCRTPSQAPEWKSAAKGLRRKLTRSAKRRLAFAGSCRDSVRCLESSNWPHCRLVGGVVSLKFVSSLQSSMDFTPEYTSTFSEVSRHNFRKYFIIVGNNEAIVWQPEISN